MEFSRISHVIDVAVMMTKCVVVVGIGGGANLCRNLVRCGLARIKLVDHDHVGPENICRQEHMADQIGMPKVDALEAELKRINPQLRVACYRRDFCTFTDEEISQHFGDADLFIFAVDNLPANARGNEVCLRLGKPGLWVGLYPNGAAGEIAFWDRPFASCFRCMVPGRFEAHARGEIANRPSDGADIFAVQCLDSIAGMIALGLLTRGSANRYGRLIEQLEHRQGQFLQVKIDPAWRIHGIDPVAKYLQIPKGSEGYFSFCTVVRRDPDPGGRCPDCRKYRRN